MEDAGAPMFPGWPRRRAAPGAEGVVEHPTGGRDSSDQERSGTQALVRDDSHPAPANFAESAGNEPANTVEQKRRFLEKYKFVV